MFTMLATASLTLAACASDSTAPLASKAASQERTSPFTPTDAQRALIGVTDGFYVVTFDPTRDQSFSLGPNHLDIPANSVCNLLGSGYGGAYWNRSCTPERGRVTLSVRIKNAASDHPQMDFQPAMRFNPDKLVQLYIYARNVSERDTSVFSMKYCNDAGNCVDEAAEDKDLQTYIDRRASVVFRRIKHFSGYVVAERGAGSSSLESF